jgi:glutathione S-transferase
VKLIQIPFSHNCVKVRIALERKRLAYDVENIPPTDRTAVFRASGQRLVPVLVDGAAVVTDSTAILRYLEERHPDPPLVPRDPRLGAECWLLEDWADRAFMEAARRIAYFRVLQQPGTLARMFFPGSTGLKSRIQEKVAARVVRRRFRVTDENYRRDVSGVRAAAALALERLGSGPYFFGAEPTVADIALASLSAPLRSDAEVAADPAVRALLAWGAPLLAAR